MTHATYPSLSGRLVVVTGGGRGIGLQTVRRFLEQGARVVVLDLAMTADDVDADFVKVDVEGYEGHVVDSLLPLLRERRIGRLMIDYHAPILAGMDVDPADVHRKVLEAGLTCDTPDGALFSGYRLYRRRD